MLCSFSEKRHMWLRLAYASTILHRYSKALKYATQVVCSSGGDNMLGWCHPSGKILSSVKLLNQLGFSVPKFVKTGISLGNCTNCTTGVNVPTHGGWIKLDCGKQVVASCQQGRGKQSCRSGFALFCSNLLRSSGQCNSRLRTACFRERKQTREPLAFFVGSQIDLYCPRTG